jgi:hypothetical protein
MIWNGYSTGIGGAPYWLLLVSLVTAGIAAACGKSVFVQLTHPSPTSLDTHFRYHYITIVTSNGNGNVLWRIEFYVYSVFSLLVVDGLPHLLRLYQ